MLWAAQLPAYGALGWRKCSAMVQWRGALERGSYQRDEGRAHQGERRELEREPLYGPGGEPHQRAGRRREDFSEGPAGDHGEGHCAVHPSAIHPLSIQGPSCPYLVHPTPKGSQNHWFGRPSPACEYPYYNIKKEGEHNVQNIRDTAHAALDSRFLPRGVPKRLSDGALAKNATLH